MALFDVVIPTYNNLLGLQKCLNSILQQKFDDYKVWICVDGSTDGTLTFLKDFCTLHPRFSFLEHADHQNKGRAVNRNQVLTHLSAPFTLFVDGDVICEPSLLAHHYAILNKDPALISIGSTDWLNHDSNIWARYIMSRGVAKHKHLEIVPYQYFTTQNVAMRSSYFLEEGGLDSNFKLYGGEDTELAYRIFKNYNAQFIFNKAAIVSTESDKTLEQALELLETFGRTNLTYIAQKHPQCSEIFYLHLLKGTDIKARVYRAILSPFIYFFSFWISKLQLNQLSLYTISFCVAYRIKKGFRAHF
jgi:glycosyltransferase involved in cell wall biosynthesis